MAHLVWGLTPTWETWIEFHIFGHLRNELEHVGSWGSFSLSLSFSFSVTVSQNKEKFSVFLKNTFCSLLFPLLGIIHMTDSIPS